MYKRQGYGRLVYAEAGDALAESLVVRLSSCKRATVRTISGEQAPDSTMSEGSSIVDEEGSAEVWPEYQSKCMDRDDDKRKDAELLFR